MSTDVPEQPVRRIAPQYGPLLDFQENDWRIQGTDGRLSHEQAGVLPQRPSQPAKPLSSNVWSALPHGVTGAEQVCDDDGRGEIGKAFDSLKSIVAMIIVALGVCAAAALAVQFISVFVTIYESPAWIQIPAICLMVLVLIATLWTGGQSIRLYWQFAANQQVSVRQWKALHTHQKQASTSTRQLKVQRLLHWLSTLSFSATYRQYLVRGGLTTGQIAELMARRDALQRAEMFGCEADWLTTFREQFQQPLDSAATNVVYAQAKHAFWRTAISPIPLLDGFLLLYGCLQMVNGICRVYQLRPAGFHALTILSEAILSAYASSKLEDVSDLTGDMTGRSIEEALPAGADAAAAVIGKVLGKVVATSAQGTLNAYFVYRIGMKTLQMVKPSVG